jgi:hypothetical protein
MSQGGVLRCEAPTLHGSRLVLNLHLAGRGGLRLLRPVEQMNSCVEIAGARAEVLDPRSQYVRR